MAYLTDIERLNYYEGEFLGATDFQAEQEYHRDMRRRHNLGQHTCGIVTGMDLAQAPNGGTSPSGIAEVDVYLQPGMAVDGFGREIVVLNQAQLTQEMFAAFFDPNPNASAKWMYIWISYQQALLQPPSDACTSQNVSNAFGRVEETYTLTATAAGPPPPSSAIVVDGSTTTPPVASSSSGSTPLPDPPPVTLPYDDSVPYQEFSTDDTNLIWWIPVGRVLWDPHNEVFLQIDPDPQKAAASAGMGRDYAGSVSAWLFAPAGMYYIGDRNTPNPFPASALSPPFGGVQVEIAGLLQVDCVLSVLANAVIGGSYDPSSTTPLSPLNIIASGNNQDLIQFRNSSGQETWYINQQFDSKTPGLNLGEVAAGKNVDNRIFIQPTQTSSSVPSPQNVGIGTSTPRNPLAVRGQGTWWELLSLEDNTGATKWHLNHNPQGKDSSGNPLKPGLNFSETAVANFRLFLQAGGNVGIGTGSPAASLDVANGFIHLGGGGTTVSSQGAYLGWNLSGGTGETDFINNQGGGSGGFAFMNAPSSGSPLSTLMTIAGNGDIGIGTTSPQQDLSVNGGLNIDQADANNGTLPHGAGPGLTFGNSSGEGIASSRTSGSPNQFGLDFYTFWQRRMSIDHSGNIGIGALPAQQNLSVNGGLNIDQADANNGTLPHGASPALTFGNGSGEGIGSTRSGPNQFSLNFYTGFSSRMSIASASQGGGVTLAGPLTVNGARTNLLGHDGANWHWIMAGGTTEFNGTTGNNAIGLSYDNVTGQGFILVNPNWSLIFNGPKMGFVVDRFVNIHGENLERGDVVVIYQDATGPLYGGSNQIPLIEVERAKTARNPRVCGVVDAPSVHPSVLEGLDPNQISKLNIGLMVTLGAYSHCKVDADIAPIAAGDLLATSPTEGHAQRLDPAAHAQPGVVIGKALASLKQGKGLIPVLISHQ
ncbi:MAG TPA: hypothetical protein VI636_25245 [Candidatus Angelobacter sp.]